MIHLNGFICLYMAWEKCALIKILKKINYTVKLKIIGVCFRKKDYLKTTTTFLLVVYE